MKELMRLTVRFTGHVQGVGFRCSAYRDPAGKWHDAFTNDELYGEIQIVE